MGSIYERMRQLIRSKLVRVLIIVLAVVLGLALVSYLVLSWWLQQLVCSPGFLNVEAARINPYYDAWSDLRRMAPRPRLQWTPNGDHIVFEAEFPVPTDSYSRDGRPHDIPGNRIYVVAADGPGLRLLTETGEEARVAIAHSPSISPDGRRIAYSKYSYRKGGPSYFEIETATLDGSDQRRLTWNGGQDFSLAWSPDGARIAFLRYDDYSPCNIPKRLGIYTMNASGSDLRMLERLSGQTISSLAWSPDGETLAFLVEETVPGIDDLDGLQVSLDTVKADGSERTRLLTEAMRFIVNPIGPRTLAGKLAWSPDSQRIAFMRQGEKVGLDHPPTRLFTIDPEDRVVREIVELHAQGDVSWSPDGSQFMISMGARDTFVVNADGSDLRHIGQGGLVAWSPDGSRIASVKPAGSDVVLYTMSPDGSDVRVLVRRVDDELFNVAGPGTGQLPSAEVACSAGVVVPDPETNPGLVRDCEALYGMRVQLKGALPLNWNVGTPIVQWESVILDESTLVEGGPDAEESSSPPRVRGLSLPRRGVLSHLPLGVTELVELRSLDLSGNSLRGKIPSDLSRLTGLRELNLSGNHLSGHIPPELGRLTSLERLDLSFNDLGAHMPPELGSLTSLKQLNLSGNDLNGHIPPEFDSLTSLERLNLSKNSLSGPIPPELSGLTSLERLNLSFNDLSGPIPSELGNLTELRYLDVGFNAISGCIPPGLRGKVRGYREPDTCGR